MNHKKKQFTYCFAFSNSQMSGCHISYWRNQINLKSPWKITFFHGSQKSKISFVWFLTANGFSVLTWFYMELQLFFFVCHFVFILWCHHRYQVLSGGRLYYSYSYSYSFPISCLLILTKDFNHLIQIFVIPISINSLQLIISPLFFGICCSKNAFYDLLFGIVIKFFSSNSYDTLNSIISICFHEGVIDEYLTAILYWIFLILMRYNKYFPVIPSCVYHWFLGILLCGLLCLLSLFTLVMSASPH